MGRNGRSFPSAPGPGWSGTVQGTVNSLLGAGTVQGTRLFALEDLKRSRNNILGSCAEPRTRTGVATPHIVTPIPVTR